MAQDMIRIPAYEWPGGHRCAVVFSADVDAESPFVWMNRGQPVNTLGELEQRRFGPRRGLARLVDLLAEFGASGSFYVPGMVMERYPWIAPGLLDEGHEVGLHGYYHERMETLDDDAFNTVMSRSLEIHAAQGATAPVGFRSPAWELGPHQIELLRAAGVAYDSSLMGFDHPYTIGGLTEIPVQWAIDDAIYFRYFGGGRDTGPPANPMQVLESWIMEFDAVAATGSLFMVTVHPWMSGRAPRIEMLRRLFTHIRSREGVWWTTAGDVARWHVASVNAERFRVAAETVRTDI
ncbi:MAG: polysaccharide deacetylase family protein [Gammaproteobacteria bacterium]